MGSRGSHLRTKIFALLLSLTALWGFAAFVTARDGLDLLWLSRLDEQVGQPSESLVDALQHERRLSVVFLGGDRTPKQWVGLTEARSRTDAAVKSFRQRATSTDARWAATTTLEDQISELIRELDELTDARSSVDSGNLSRDGAVQVFGDLIDATFRIYGSLSTLDDEEIARYGRALIGLSRARELLAREDALLAGAHATGRLSAADIVGFVQLVGAQRNLTDQAVRELPDTGVALYEEFVRGDRYTRFRAHEDRVMERARANAAAPVSAVVWQPAAQGALDALREMVLRATEDAVARSGPVAAWVIVRLLMAGGLGLVAVVASIIVSITTARALVRQLERLRTAAWQLAQERLPDVVARLGRGETVDVAAEAPPLSFGTDEIGQVGQAFNAVQQTAIKVAVEQAELRRSVRDVFLSLARRTQAMVHRQLTLLDAMERQDHDPAVLDDLFRIDHLATRMRRNAENLIVLSGATPGRAWRRSVPMVDVLRGAVAEVEDYTRVNVLPVESIGLAGRAVGDVIHLVAELVENALSFSPPHTPVQVSGQPVANGFAVEIEDRGLGMSEADLVQANAKLANPPEFNLAGAAQLGLYVVSRLAERHGIRVRLKDSPYGGTTAVVLIPRPLVADGTGEQDQSGALLPVGGGSGRPAEPNGARVDRAGLPAVGWGTALAVAPDQVRRPEPVRRSEPVRRVAQPDPAQITQPIPVAGAADAVSVVVPEQRPGPAADPAPAPSFTPSGLPVRVRQANLPPRPADAAPAVPEPGRPALAGESASTDEGRSPEEIRKIMTSYQAGTLRGRSEDVHPEGDVGNPPAEADRTPG